uniref:Secreted protein n=1 Tax=Anopheles darlingi TaxID=43151 RepID=A0A2M4DS38_ANODA
MFTQNRRRRCRKEGGRMVFGVCLCCLFLALFFPPTAPAPSATVVSFCIYLPQNHLVQQTSAPSAFSLLSIRVPRGRTVFLFVVTRRKREMCGEPDSECVCVRAKHDES